MSTRTFALVILTVAVAGGRPARADRTALPGACVTPSPPPQADGTPSAPRATDPIDLDGDGKPDVIIGGDDCDGRSNCNYNAYVMRGACGYLVGFGSDQGFDGRFALRPDVHAGLHDVEAHFLGMGDFETHLLTFDGTHYVDSVVDSAKRGGDAPTGADTLQAYRAAMAKARKLENAGDHNGAVAAFRVALAAGATLGGDAPAQAALELGASALAAGMLDVAEEQTRNGLFEMHGAGDAAHAKLLAMGWFNLGMISEATGDLTNAVDAYDQSVRRNPTAAAKQRLAAAKAVVLKTTLDGKGLPALSADGATLALRLGTQIAFVPVGAGFDAKAATALSAATLADVNRRLAAGGFRTVASRRIADSDAAPTLQSLGIATRIGTVTPTGRSVWVGFDGLEHDVAAGQSWSLATVPDTKSLTGVAIVQAPKAAFLYLEVAGRSVVVIPLAVHPS